MSRAIQRQLLMKLRPASQKKCNWKARVKMGAASNSPKRFNPCHRLRSTTSREWPFLPGNGRIGTTIEAQNPKRLHARI